MGLGEVADALLHCFSGGSPRVARIFRGRADCSASAGWMSLNYPSSLTQPTPPLLRAPRAAGRFDKLTVPDNGDHLPLGPEAGRLCHFRLEDRSFRDLLSLHYLLTPGS